MATTSAATQKATSTVKRATDELASGVENAAGNIKGQARSAANRVKSEADSIEASLTRGAEELAANVGEKLRSAGLDTDKIVDVAREQASELQRLIEDEIRDRPLRALGLAAAVGLFVGFLSAR
jgi:ElaB/YqjD/DUF883 family membrane-anchored ribosome-binding protein